MSRKLGRRRFLASALTASWTMSCTSDLLGQSPPERKGRLDIHLHLFGVGDSGSGCRLDNSISEGPMFKLLAEKLRIKARAPTMDEGYVLALAEQLKASGLTKGVVLAQDAAYDSNGKPNWRKTPFYVPNDYMLQVVARFPKLMIPCVSINPQRADAISELDQCAAKGAKVLKIHPPIQGVDLLEKKFVPFFRRCAELKYLVMVHTGHEHSAPIVSASLANPRKLSLALDEGCNVVACHCGTGWPTDPSDMLADFLTMIRKYENLWGDTSVLGTAGRVRDMYRLLADSEAKDRLLHGSDFPFPSAPIAFIGKLGAARASKLQAINNSIKQDFALKDALGIGPASAERAYKMVTQTESPS